MTVTPSTKAVHESWASSNDTMLVDRHNRTFTYMRVAVTDRCQLRCIYCMPAEGIDFTPNEGLLKSDEILRIIGVGAALGVNKIRFTGGEPLLRADILDLIRGSVNTPGITSVNLTSNGLRVKELASDLAQIGLSGINISLDTLDEAKFAQITRRERLQDVLDGVKAALEVGIPSVKLNVVALKGFNDDELGAFAMLTKDDPVTVRIIELMPFDAHQIWKTGRHMHAGEIQATLEKLFPNLEKATGTPTEHYITRIPGHLGKMAIIPAYTRSLCGNCDRIRITADGCIRNCLYSDNEYSLRDLMREGGTDDDLGRVLRGAMWDKEVDGWASQRAKDTGPDVHHRESMTQIGG